MDGSDGVVVGDDSPPPPRPHHSSRAAWRVWRLVLVLAVTLAVAAILVMTASPAR